MKPGGIRPVRKLKEVDYKIKVGAGLTGGNTENSKILS
jgi:hypothetical protein